ncbi:hypothetical protein CJ030_MR1G027735 [Morella rubra]|uniref:Uncharacterized protein n=1 Tax=Morella rubra TaxID=262757 RepID=A0A6A1WR75_9ROSI|nr:hypothetical protein CJ030_MR1G027735 [Morella rubra]
MTRSHLAQQNNAGPNTTKELANKACLGACKSLGVHTNKQEEGSRMNAEDKSNHALGLHINSTDLTARDRKGCMSTTIYRLPQIHQFNNHQLNIISNKLQANVSQNIHGYMRQKKDVIANYHRYADSFASFTGVSSTFPTSNGLTPIIFSASCRAKSTADVSCAGTTSRTPSEITIRDNAAWSIVTPRASTEPLGSRIVIACTHARITA